MNNAFQPVAICTKSSILDVWLDSEQVFFLFHLKFMIYFCCVFALIDFLIQSSLECKIYQLLNFLFFVCILFVLYFFDKCRPKICIFTEKWTLACDPKKCCLQCDNTDPCLSGCHYWFRGCSYQSEVFYKLAVFIKAKISW